MDRIEIIDLEEDVDSDDEEDNSEEEEESEEDGEEEIIEDEKYEEHKSLIKQKTDRDLMENISLRLLSLEIDMKHVRDDLVDIYNLVLEGEAEED
jgi:hypothetical protein